MVLHISSYYLYICLQIACNLNSCKQTKTLIMGVNVKIVLDKRNQKKDNSYPLILRIISNRRSASIPTGYSLLEDDWDDEAKEVKKSYKGVSNIKRLNKLIQKKKVSAMDIINQLEDGGEINNLSVKEIKARIVNKHSNIQFYIYAEEIIREMNKSERFGYARSINNALQAVKSFTNDRDFQLKDLDYKFLTGFENFCRKRGNTTNTIAVYMRTIKMIVNRGIKSKIIKRDNYPFSEYSIKTTKTQKRAVPKQVIDLIEKCNLKKDSRVWHARNYFLFSFYAMGMNFADIAYLKPSNIIEGRIEYKRRKTNKTYSIKTTPPIKEILSIYLKDKTKDDYIFPIITQGDTPQRQYQEFFEQRRVYNQQLKEIAKEIDIETNLTSYVARHSWATVAKHKGVPTEVISEGMGHADVKTTEIYLDAFDRKVLDDYNDLITIK